MKNQKWLRSVLVILFIILSGVFYSCRSTNNREAILTLQNQQNNVAQTEERTTEDVTDESLEDLNDNLTEETKEIITTKTATKYIYIHICGAVNKPDVYEVEENARIFDLIELAGGLRKDAAGDYVNQAALVEDGQQIYIPTMDEVKDTSPTEYEVIESSSDLLGKVNINTATKEELMTLSGIGEAKAKSIIEYRQDNEGFQDIEEIKKIDGIKDSVYEKICEMIIVN